MAERVVLYSPGVTADLGELMSIALTAADAARRIVHASGPAVITEKADRDLVSDIDVAIEREVRGYLRQVTPDIEFLGEEEGGDGDPGTGWRWVLDPIDGTSNFAHGIPLCATSLALVHDGHSVLGVIDVPFLAQRYHAVESGGAWNGARRLAVSATASLREAIVATGDYATGHGADRQNQAQLAVTSRLIPRVHRIRMLGTAAIDLAWLAEGRLDASITLTNPPWDMAAGVIIAREAGAMVVDIDGSPHSLRSAATIAAAPQLIPQILPLVRDHDASAHQPGQLPH
jgi:myo-inositol-1(or 4)-monophosphatase